jgi:hypothetical protein
MTSKKTSLPSVYGAPKNRNSGQKNYRQQIESISEEKTRTKIFRRRAHIKSYMSVAGMPGPK